MTYCLKSQSPCQGRHVGHITLIARKLEVSRKCDLEPNHSVPLLPASLYLLKVPNLLKQHYRPGAVFIHMAFFQMASVNAIATALVLLFLSLALERKSSREVRWLVFCT